MANRDIKMLIVTNYQGSENENHNKILLHTCQDGCYQKHKRQQELARM